MIRAHSEQRRPSTWCFFLVVLMAIISLLECSALNILLMVHYMCLREGSKEGDRDRHEVTVPEIKPKNGTFDLIESK